MSDTQIMTILAEAFQQCDHLLIGAGAGLSAAAGLSFADETLFKERYPQLYAQGVHSDYQTFSYRAWNSPTFWGYFSDHLYRVMVETPPLPLYQELLQLVRKKDFFVITSNVDGQFTRAGFPSTRLFEYQGSFAYLACEDACCEEVWDALPLVAIMRRHTDGSTMRVKKEALPTCPHCGALLAYAGRRVPGYQAAKARYEKWLKRSESGLTCIMEFGVGFNSAGIIRVPFERIVGERPKDHVCFFRITTDYQDSTIEIAYPEIPKPIADKSISINADAGLVITQLSHLIGNATKENS